MKNEELVLVNPDDTVESPYHRRQHWGDLDALAQSIVDVGVLQPARGRRKNGHIELIFGHRRRRAAKKAGVQFPVLVGDMDDAEVIEAQITENLEREDLHPMDEAELFGQLLERKLSVEDIANRRGCEQEYVRSRTKLLSLAKSVRKMFVEGKFGAEVAFVIARIPDAKLQKKAADHLATNQRGYVYAVEDARNLVRREYMLDLRSAPFDVAEDGLVSKVKSCASCPKRTGQQRELFGELKKRDDLCLDPKCWADKATAAWKIKSAAARKDGLKVLSAKDGKEAFNPHHYGNGRHALAYNSGFVDADQETSDYRLKTKDVRKSWAKLLGGALPEIALAKDPGGSPRRLVNRKAAERALRKVGLVKTEKKATSPAAQGKQARKNRLIKKEAAHKAIEQLGAEAEATTFGKDSKLLQVLAYLGASAHQTEMAKLYGEKEKGFAESLLAEPDGYRLLKFTLEAALFGWLHEFGRKGYGSEFITACEHLGVDVLAIEKEIADEKKAAAKPKKKVKAKKSAAKKKPAAKKTRAKK